MRDNLIYLMVALSIVGLIVADFIHADSRGRQMWWPSRLASRGVYTTILLAYFVTREARKLKATAAQVIACVLFGAIVHLAIIFAFRQAVEHLSGITFSALAVCEMFLVFELLMNVVRYLRAE